MGSVCLTVSNQDFGIIDANVYLYAHIQVRYIQMFLLLWHDCMESFHMLYFKFAIFST